ncbi:ATP-binding protein [Thermincola ferriacetica]
MVKKQPIGYINFDGSPGENNIVEIRVPGDRLEKIRRGQYVLLESKSTGSLRVYLARVVKGPFYVPDAVSRDSAYARASILQGDEISFRPDFHGVCLAEVLGELMDSSSLVLTGTSGRPLPQTAVTPLNGDEIEKLLGLAGDMYLGELSGYPGVRVHFRNDDKKVLPRNLGVFGTVGSGKTNTSQVLIEEASACGWAVVVLDVEGEYVEMDAPSSEAEKKPAMKRLMEKYGVEPRGIENLQVFHCTGTEPARPEISQEFGIRFANVDVHILGEILGLTDAQMDRLLESYYQLINKDEQGKTKKRKQGGLVSHLIGDIYDDSPSIGLELSDVIEAVARKAASEKQGKVSWQVLLRKLRKLDRYRIFDTSNHLGDYSDLVKGGQVSIFDLSNSHNVWINNIVISDILRGLFKIKLRDKESKTPPVLVIIEEAHTFVSKENVKHMEATLDVLRDISRRGRKRWLSLCFISQQPSHLPSEIYELCNTKFVHQTTGGKNLDALKNSTGAVNDAIWGDIPVLGQGRCLIISPQFKHPVMCDMRPCSSNRRMTD